MIRLELAHFFTFIGMAWVVAVGDHAGDTRSDIEAVPVAAPNAHAGRTEVMKLIASLLHRRIRRGELRITDHDGRMYHFGSPDPDLPPVGLRFMDRRTALDIARKPALGFAEAWMDGRVLMDGGEILDFVKLLRLNVAATRRRLGADLIGLRARLARVNWRWQSRRHVAHTYDLSTAFYELFLDKELQYTCAYFSHPGETLEEAQLGKMAHIAAKLRLQPGQRVLDIGCGWGGLALFLNRVADVDVLGITLSQEQLTTARERAARAGVSDRVRFELMDYRDIPGRFDRIVSVGMFEHVGPDHYRAFFRKCCALLPDDGVLLLHTIGRSGSPGPVHPFTAKYIFPGGYIPAISEIVDAGEHEQLLLSDCETLRLHYYYTLEQWYMRVKARRTEIVAMFDERFYRMWTLYLTTAMTSFLNGGLVNYQLQYVRDRLSLPLTRNYMLDDEVELRRRGVSSNACV